MTPRSTNNHNQNVNNSTVGNAPPQTPPSPPSSYYYYPPNWPTVPFHEGELDVQHRLGVHDDVMSYGPKGMRPYMPQQHIDFYTNQPFIVAAARDNNTSNNKMWATLLFGSSSPTREDQSVAPSSSSSSPLSYDATGFISSPDQTRLTIRSTPLPGDASEHSFNHGTDLGLLGIEFATRRRNRVNGRVMMNLHEDDDDHHQQQQQQKKKTTNQNKIEFHVDVSFGNCPQYIKPRDWWTVNPTTTTATKITESAILTEQHKDGRKKHRRPDHLNDEQMQHLRQAETIFIATGYRPYQGEGDDENDIRFGNDASHRGGSPGFLKVSNDGRRIMIPDFAGNNMHMTNGNLVMDDRMGLTVPLYTTGGMIQLTGHTKIHWTPSEMDEGGTFSLKDFPGAHRWLEFTVDEVNELPSGSLPIRWDSGNNKQLQVQVYDKIEETNDVTSFYLAPVPGESPILPAYHAGQHLTLNLETGDGETMSRSYSLSSYSKNCDHYRISVRRDPFGSVSQLLHDKIENGNILTIQVSGDFVLDTTEWTSSGQHDPEERIIFLSAGIGITPILSMLYSYVAHTHNSEHRPPKSLWIHSTRDGRSHAFREEVQDLRRRSDDLMSTTTIYTRPNENDKGRYDISGRLDGVSLKKILIEAGVEPSKTRVYICGPSGFVSAMETSLESLGVPEHNISYETF
mmetsp:Transcript_15270/g.37697  ORF Transcript_15270/g.37697 Transcript_15270/m.37697 type:complete len:682 (+) Transcript_15270:390-2435(+)